MPTEQAPPRLRVGILGRRPGTQEWAATLAGRVDVVEHDDLETLLSAGHSLLLVFATPAETPELAARIAERPRGAPLAVLVGPGAEGHPLTQLVLALVEGKREWEGTFDAIVDPVAILDAKGVVKRANLGLARTLALPIQDVVDRDYRALLGRTELGFKDPIGLSLGDGQPRTEDARFEALSGIFQVTTSPLNGAEGHSQGLVVILKDVNELREQQERLSQALRLADIGLLAAGIAHEINTPLASIALRAESLLKSAEDPTLQENPSFKNFARYLKTIDAEIFRCKKIIAALLDFSRVRKPEVRETDLNQLAEKATDLVGHQMKLKQVNLALDLDPSLPHIKADDGQLRQVLIALLMNALDAVSAGGHVKIETRRADADSVKLTVGDDGAGIPPEIRDKIFTPFFTTKPLGQGTGLGLAICHGIVASHGGEIQVESEPGAGTRIILLLPIAATAQGPASQRPSV